MAVPRRHGAFLLLAASLALVSLGAGAWLFWLSGARQLLLAGGLMLSVTVLTLAWWRRLPPEDRARSRDAGPDSASAS